MNFILVTLSRKREHLYIYFIGNNNAKYLNICITVFYVLVLIPSVYGFDTVVSDFKSVFVTLF